MERADATATRETPTAHDLENYRGICRHPMARKWLMRRLIDCKRMAVEAEDAETRQRYIREVERWSGELKRGGVEE